jgi:hypothetical protein
MRHFLRLARAPGALPGGMPRRSQVAQLVVFTGTAQRLPPADPGAFAGTVLVAPVTVAADPHLLRAAHATVEPIRRWVRPHSSPRVGLDKAAQQWHKGRANVPLCARACGRPGVPPRIVRAFAYSASGNKDSAKASRYASGDPQGSRDDRSLDIRLRVIQSDDQTRNHDTNSKAR